MTTRVPLGVRARAVAVVAAALVCLVAVPTGPTPAAAYDTRSSPAVTRWSAALSLAKTSAPIRSAVPFSAVVTPVPRPGTVVTTLQVKSGTQWRRVSVLSLDRAGRAAGTLASTTTGVRYYRVVAISRTGVLLAASKVSRLTWTEVSLSAVLTMSAASAPVGVRVPFTVAVVPAASATGKLVQVQVKDRSDQWVTFAFGRLDAAGRYTGTIEGLAVGLGRYQAVVLGPTGTVLAVSPQTTVSWTDPGPPMPGAPPSGG